MSDSQQPASKVAIEIDGVDFCYGKSKALDGITMSIPKGEIVAFIGPSGCGKSTFLRCFNRMNDLVPGARVTAGTIHIDGTEIHSAGVDSVELRRRVGMVFQKSNPFPRSIYENVAYGPRLAGKLGKNELDEIVENALRGSAGGQQQRLCIARTIAVKPEIVLMDEPCSALDPIAAAKVEELILELRKNYTIVIVTHNMQQATRVSDRTAFFYLGKLIEYDHTTQLFTKPQHQQTEDYVTGRFS